MRKFCLKSLLLAWVAIAPVALIANDVILSQSSFDFGPRERAEIVSFSTYQLINQGNDTVSVLSYSDATPFSQTFGSMQIAPGETIEATIDFDRTASEGNYTAILHVYFVDDTLSMNVSGSIVDNTPAFTQSEILQWVGTGANHSILVVDFNSGLESESVAFGYKYDNTATSEDMIAAIASAYPDFIVDMAGGFLNDLSYQQQTGMGGNPEYWMTASRTETGLWSMNWGISTVLNDGDWFGCTYGPVDENWNPINLPGNPVPAGLLPIFEPENPSIKIFPNPCSDFISISSGQSTFSNIEILDMNGKIWLSDSNMDDLVDVRNFPAGIYTIQISNDEGIYSSKFIKK
ncbi:MAG: T9SS type A sorting domain-containing protein [Bacteroidales bacterium]|nr:T9SS type A sorting domain-containing protein [Bacteroidales bacterium]MCF8456647.1 T9SS type A sorting domain-containing protein [Bacteroidales bacterium]